VCSILEYIRNKLERQYLPALEDIGNIEVKRLAKKLRGQSDKETLTNVLEWLERNVQYWPERFYLFNLILIAAAVASALMALLVALLVSVEHGLVLSGGLSGGIVLSKSSDCGILSSRAFVDFWENLYRCLIDSQNSNVILSPY